MKWLWPLLEETPEVPVGDHPGAFGAVRKYDIHTGVDLYAPNGAQVIAVESGQVVAVLPFTGEAVGSPWWQETWIVMVEGASGVVGYGEVDAEVEVGSWVAAGFPIGTVRRVLLSEAREDIPGHLPSMLHLELYQAGTKEPVWWRLGEAKPGSLLDPTKSLTEAKTHD